MVSKGSSFADFVRFRPYTYLRTHPKMKILQENSHAEVWFQ